MQLKSVLSALGSVIVAAAHTLCKSHPVFAIDVLRDRSK